MADGPLSRRALLTGAGLAVGAGALGPIVNVPRAGAGAVPVAESGVGVPAAAPPAGVKRSLRLNAFDFWPEDSQDGRFVSALGAYTNVNPGSVEAVVRLPDGATLTRVDWKLTNNSGAKRSVQVYRLTWPFLSLSLLGSTVAGSSVALQSVSTVLNTTPVDPNVYLLRMATPTNGTAGIYTAELFYTDPSVSLRLVNPQVRKLDTRQPGLLSGKLTPHQARTLLLTPELSAGAAAALLSLTVTATEGAGFLSLFPAGEDKPLASTINWSAQDQTLASSVTVAVSAAGGIGILCGGFGQTHAVIDLVGSYV
jgi:hypothetical protein